MLSSIALLYAVILQGILSTSAEPVLLPRANGTYTVGLSITDTVDEKALQPFAPGPEPRALAVSIFYPTDANSTTAVPYMPPKTAQLEDLEWIGGYSLPAPRGLFEHLALQLAHNGTKISPARGHAKWPVLIFDGGFNTSRLLYNAIVSEVASHGYVVVTFDTPYDTDYVEYLNGTVVAASTSLEATTPDLTLGVNTRAQDASFVLDQLTDASKVEELIPGCSHCLNTSHVGMFGHSLGGAASATVMLNDTRFAGGLNLNGGYLGEVIQRGLDRPMMLMTAENQTRANVSQPANPAYSWYEIWPRLRGPKFDFVFTDALHYTYSDFPIVLDTVNVQPNASTLQAMQLTPINGTRALHVVTSYTLAFFDFVLAAKESPLLRGPSPLFPEIFVDNTTSN